MITLFACPRSFTDEHIALIQTKAIQSWLLLEPRPQIILLGNEKGVKEISQEYDIEHIPDIEVSP
ncbi:MAG: glycosyl transferase family 2, partial [Nitrososphaerota archaeon]